MLYAETPHTKLTLAEVAQELSTTPEEVKKMVEHNWLDAEKDANGDLLIEKDEVRDFTDYALRDGIQLRVYTPKERRPNSAKEFQKTSAEIAAAASADLPAKIDAISKKVMKEFNLKKSQ